MITLALAPRGPEFTTFEVSKHDWELRGSRVRISVHVGVGQAGSTEAGREGRADCSPRHDLHYCCTLSDEEIQMIADTGGTVSLACPVEMQMGHGLPPIQRCLDRGLRPSLSVDVETTMSGDLFAQMRSVLTLQRSLINERRLNGEENLPAVLTSRESPIRDHGRSAANGIGAQGRTYAQEAASHAPHDRITCSIKTPSGVVRGIDSANGDRYRRQGRKRQGPMTAST